MKDGRMNILLVEDNPGDARLVSEMLKECGGVSEIKHAGRLDSALKILAGRQFDVVLLDINLPDSSGLQGLERITALHPRTAVILLTGMDDESLAVRAIQRRAGDYLIKGQINPFLLVRSMRYAIKRRQSEELLVREKESLEALAAEKSRELLDAHQELERARRLSDIGTLAATVAHELRNPLAAIALAAANIRRKAAGPDLEKHFQNIDKKISESNRIISNLLFYSRLKTPQYEAVALDEVLEECAHTAQNAPAAGTPAEIDLKLPENLALEADPVQLKEVFSNILGNALDAVAGGRREKKISVRAESGAASVKVTVSDTGQGIDGQILNRIFEPFFTTKAKGNGLGLCVCRQIVDLHGGAISVESEPGKGTLVSVTLPRKRQK